jgi:hypothetical protein
MFNIENKLEKDVQQKLIQIQQKIPHICGCHSFHVINEIFSKEIKNWYAKNRREILFSAKTK